MVKDRKKYLKKYDKIYSRRPDVIARKKERRDRPKVKARKREYSIKYHKRFTFFNPDGTIIKEAFEKAFAPENHEWMTVKMHKKLDHSKL